MNGILSTLRQMISQLFIPREEHLIFRPRSNGGTRSRGQTNQGSVPNNGSRRSNPLDPLHAAEEIYAPRHGEETRYMFTAIPKNGDVLHQSEVWKRKENSLLSTITNAFLITASGSVVPTADQIKARCYECEGMEDVIIRCARCGVSLCRLHAYIIYQSSPPVAYCKRHIQEALADWDTWAAYDQAKGVAPKPLVHPNRFWSVASLRGGKGS
jgi:hypothetical protein